MPTKSMIRTAAALGLALATAPAGGGFAAEAGSFDGAWSVEIDCPAVGDVQAYSWRFPVQISSGALSGRYHSPTNSAMGTLSGRVRPDGEALVTVAGRTGPGRRPDTPQTCISTRVAARACATKCAPAR